MPHSYEIPIASTGKVSVAVLQPPNNGVIYTLGVWDKPTSQWQFGPKSGIAMPGDPVPDIYNLGAASEMNDDYFCISAKLIPLDGAPQKYWVVFQITSERSTKNFKSNVYNSPQQVDLVYQFTH